jgi:hypothetical protein
MQCKLDDSFSFLIQYLTSSLFLHIFLQTCEVGLKGDIKDKLPVILFDEELRTRESQYVINISSLTSFSTPISHLVLIQIRVKLSLLLLE